MVRSKLALLVAVLLVVVGCGQQSQPTEAPEAQEPVDRVTTGTVLTAEELNEGTFGEETPGPQPRPDLSVVPDRTAPGALGRVELPAQPEEIRAMLASMPETLAGEQRDEIPQLAETASRYDLGYGQVELEGISMGPKLHLTVIDVQSGDFFPTNWTGPDVIAFRFAFSEDPQEEDDAFSYEAGRDGEVLWMFEESFMGAAGTSETQATFSLMWAEADSKWLFGAVADTPEHLDLLVAALSRQPRELGKDAKQQARQHHEGTLVTPQRRLICACIMPVMDGVLCRFRH